MLMHPLRRCFDARDKDRRKEIALGALMEQLIEHGPTDIASVLARVFEPVVQIARERFPGAGHHERTPERRGYANGTKRKRIDTPSGTVNVQVPKTAGHEGEPFYPRSPECGRRSGRAVMLAVAEMYIKGVSAPPGAPAFTSRHVCWCLAPTGCVCRRDLAL